MIVETLRYNILRVARAYAQARDLSLTTVSKQFYGTTTFLADFEKGRGSVSVDKLEAMFKKFKDQWPKGARWPYMKPLYIEGKKAPAPRAKRHPVSGNGKSIPN